LERSCVMQIHQSLRSTVWRLCFVMLAIAGVAGAQTDVCITGVGGLGGVPTIDGQVEGDAGWNNAVRLNLSGDLGASTATKMMLGIAGTSLYLGLEVSAPGITRDTTVVLAFSANDGNAANDWRLHIQPFD